MREKIERYIRLWESRCYSDGIPDTCPGEIFEMVPSYHKIALAILKNDHNLKLLGYNVDPCEAYKFLKRIEIEARNIYPKQLKLF